MLKIHKDSYFLDSLHIIIHSFVHLAYLSANTDDCDTCAAD